MPEKICRIFFLILIGLKISTSLKAQVPSSSFSAPVAGCIGESLIITNNSSSASIYEWDFCEGDLSTTPTATNIGSLAGAFNPRNMDLVKDGTEWVAFAASSGTNSIYRIDFGPSISNQNPTISNLGNIGNLLDRPISIRLVKESNTWLALVINNSNPSLIRINFGSSLLNNAPSAEKVIDGFSANNGLAIQETGAGKVLVATNISTNTVTLVDFKTSFLSTPQVSDVITTPALAGGDQLDDVKISNYQGDWYGFVVSGNSKKILRLDFGSNLFSVPATVDVTGTLALSGGDFPTGITVQWDAGKFISLVQTFSGQIYVGNYGSTFLNTAPTYTNAGTFSSNAINLEIVKVNSNWYGFAIDYSNLTIKQIAFSNNCSANTSTSQAFEPSGEIYTQPGTYTISLITRDQNSNFDYSSSAISISNLIAPDIDFSTQNICVDNPINFSPINQSGNISLYSWDFGDGGTSSGSGPSHTYSTPSIYTASLTVTASNGCQNFAQNSVQIFNAPQANFTLPTASPLCTNQNYLFTNTSTSDAGSNPTWQWNVNGTDVSVTQDLNYLFTSSSSQSISLTASIPGCSTQSIQSVNNLNDGPLVSFSSPSTSCAGTNVVFTNTTSGSVINTSWTYGDGNSSSQTNGANAYSTAGIFSVKLSSSNAAGCQNSFSKNISIYSLPQPDFAIEAPPLSCANTPSKFDNLTAPLTDSNVSTWNWSFGDANSGSSNQKNPSYLYTLAGNYNVSLQAITNFGCSKSIQKQITIFPSPQAGFTNSAACVNQSTHLSDASTGSITSYQWNVQSNVLSGATPSYVFKSSGSFPVTLTVTGSNGCLNQTTKSITVPVMPVVDFSVSAPCTGHPTHFQEVNFGGADPAVAWNWNFEQSSGTGSPVSYQFTSEGGHTVIMNTTRQSGCVYSISKNISISAGPIASFSPSVFAGAAPLDVTFNNTSTADSYVWQFDDANQSTSTNTSPEFVYPSLGKYKVLLTAYNTLGCSDTLSTEIDVVVPHIDIVMNNFSLTNDPNSNSSKAVVTILNSGNIPLVDPEVLIDFGGNASIKEKISGLIRPGKSLIQTLGLQIVPHSLEYICAEIDITNDVNSANNKQCVSLSNEDVVMTPYPNPSTSGQVTIAWVGAVQENAVVTIFRSNGEIAFEQNLNDVNKGLGQLTINTSSFSNGLYLVQFAGGKTTKTFRIMIAN